MRWRGQPEEFLLTPQARENGRRRALGVSAALEIILTPTRFFSRVDGLLRNGTLWNVEQLPLVSRLGPT